jgi:hypothetical protein
MSVEVKPKWIHFFSSPKDSEIILVKATTSCFVTFSISNIRAMSTFAFAFIFLTSSVGTTLIFAQPSTTLISTSSHMFNLFSSLQIFSMSEF